LGENTTYTDTCPKNISGADIRKMEEVCSEMRVKTELSAGQIQQSIKSQQLCKSP